MHVYLLKDVEHEVSGLVQLVVVLDVGLLELLLGGELPGLLDALHDSFGSHSARLGCEVDALSRALGDVTRSVTHEGHAADHPSWAVVLGDGVRLDLDDLSPLDLGSRALADGVLKSVKRDKSVYVGRVYSPRSFMFFLHQGVSRAHRNTKK